MTALHVPAAMAARRQWVVWKRELINGRWTKPPYRADGLGRASVTDPSTWSTLEDAQVALMNGGGFAGLGYVFTEDDDTTGGDVDHTIASPEACTVIEKFRGTYCEESPGGGLHVLAIGKLPLGAGNRRGGYELYDSGRYFTFTGKHVSGTALELTPQPDALNWFADTLIGRNGGGHAPPGGGDGHVPPGGGNGHNDHRGEGDQSPKQPEQPDHRLADEELIRRIAGSVNAAEFKRLMEVEEVKPAARGKGGKEGDNSANDQSLCNLLAFWTSGNADQMERIWGRSNLAKREKWQREDYRRMTIASALTHVHGRYHGRVGPEPTTTEDHRPPPTPLLPETFWEATETLRRIRAVARHRRVMPDVLYSILLARTAALLPRTLRLLSEGIPNPPNLFCAVTGRSGRGKSKALAWARQIIPCPDYLGDGFDNDGQGLASGEGVLQMFLEWDQELKKNVQVYHNAFVYCDEGSILEKLNSRDGATAAQHLMVAFTGGRLSTPNAAQSTRRSVLDYNLSLVLNLTSSAAQYVLSQRGLGLPQRFLWFGAWDPGATRSPFADFTIQLPEEGGLVRLAPDIDEELAAQLEEDMRTDDETDNLDAHATWMRTRVGMIHTLWDDPKRRQIERREWDLAGIVMANSAAVRDRLIELNRRAKQDEEAERTAVRISTSQQIRHADAAIPRVALNLAKKVWEAEGGRIGRSELCAKKIARRDRSYFDSAVDHAKGQLWIVDDGISGFAKGSKKP